MYTYIVNKLGCTKEEAKELEFEPIILFSKLNMAIGSFYNKTEEPYIVIYNSIYTDPDDNETPTKITRLSLVRYKIIKKRTTLDEFTSDEMTEIIKNVVNNWNFIRELYLYSYINKFGKCAHIPKKCPYATDKYITNIDTENKLWKWED